MQDKIDAIADSFPFGRPSAVKRGRNPQWPYVPVILDYLGHPGATHNPMRRRAYASRAEATEAAGQYIAAFRAKLRADLADPRMRALRQQYGLPRDI